MKDTPQVMVMLMQFYFLKMRAAAVKDFLVKLGVNPDRLKTEGYGEERPIADNETLEGRALNRRVQFRTEF